jgi:opacity protein-like surface antigen
MDRQIRAGLGMIYSTMKNIQIGFSYEYINFGHAEIQNTSSNGVLAGSYSKNYANVLQASVNVEC